MKPARRIVTFNRVTADGYFAAPDGSLNWVVPDEKVDKDGVEEIPRFDTVLFGRRTYEMFASFWPNAVSDSPAATDPHATGRRSPEMHAMGTMLNESTKVVFSRTLKDATWKNSQLRSALDPREIESMKAQPGKDMIIFGSGSIVSELTRHALIDEYQFVISPTLLGTGRVMISGVPTDTRLNLLEVREYPSGNVMLRYARAT